MHHPRSAGGVGATTNEARVNMDRRLLLLLLLLCGLLLAVGCASKGDRGISNVEAVQRVDMVRNPVSTLASLRLALEQVERTTAPVQGRTAKLVRTVSEGVSELGRFVDHPILAAAEYHGWFWYATDVARDSETKEVKMFIAGYAIRKGGDAVIQWSV